MTQPSFLQRVWGLRKPRRLASVVLRRLHLSHLVTMKVSGVRMKFFPAVNLMYLWDEPDLFAHDTEFLQRYLRPGDVFVDCGANVGQLTLVAAAAVAPDGVVYSIEAHPKIFRYLEHHVELNRAANVRLFHAAVGEREGSITFSDGHADDGNHIVTGGQGIEVRMLPVDSIVPEGTRVRMLKLDVEGYEKLALEGAARLLSTTDCVYYESSDRLFGRYGYTCRDVFDLLERAGFTVFHYGDRLLTRLPPDYHSVPIENLVALRDADEFVRTTGYPIR